MSQVITQYEGVVTVRLDGRISAQELSYELKSHLDTRAGGPVIVIVDLAFVQALGQQVKASMYRVLQHHNVLKVGFAGATPDVAAELADMLPVLSRIRPVALEHTEADVRQKFGLSAPASARKFGGMLSYLKQA